MTFCLGQTASADGVRNISLFYCEVLGGIFYSSDCSSLNVRGPSQRVCPHRGQSCKIELTSLNVLAQDAQVFRCRSCCVRAKLVKIKSPRHTGRAEVWGTQHNPAQVRRELFGFPSRFRRLLTTPII